MLVGREVELQSIRQLLAAARLGRSGGCLLTGEPGIGKSAVLGEAESLAQGMSVLRATGREADSRVPFGGLLELLRPTLDALPRIPAPQQAAVAGALALDGADDTAVGRFAVGAGVLSLMCRHAESRPLLVVLDDLQWLDPPSLQAIRFAVGRLADDPIAVLAATREPGTADWDAAWGLPVRGLRGLDLAAAGVLLADRAALATNELVGLHRATDGNPLALLELARAPDAGWASYPEGPVATTASVAASYSTRVQELSSTIQEVLLVVAVTGADVRAADAACGRLGIARSDVVEALTAAEAAGLVRLRGDHVDFQHPLIRSAVYAGAASATRRRTHRAVADGLADDPDRRAWHLAEAAVLPDEGLARQLEAVAERSAGRAAHGVAALAHERAAQLSPAHAAARTRHLAAAQQAWLSGDAALTARLLDAADDVGGPHPSAPAPTSGPSVAALALRGELTARTLSGDPTPLLSEAARLAPDPEVALGCLVDAVADCFYRADGRTALELAGRLEEVLPVVTTDLSVALGRMAIGMARILAGADAGAEQVRAALDLMAARPPAELVLEGLDPTSHPQRVGWLLLGPLWLRDAAGVPLRRAADELRRRAALGVLPCLLFQVARDEATTDRWAAGQATYTEGIRFARESGQARDLVMSLSGLAWLEARCGHARESAAYVEQARAVDPQGQLRHAHMWQLFAVGEQALADGRADEALRVLEELDGLQRHVGFGDVDMSPGPELAEALCHLGRRGDARGVAADYADRAERKGQPWAQARAARALGLVASTADLDSHFGTALARHAETLDGFETARTRLLYGARLRRARRRRDARDQLRRAVEAFDALGAEPWAARAAAELDATGETAQRRELGAAGRLTPQELQVAGLLAEGRTTREAAAALFLSPKTVEYHLRKAYNKLGVASRDALAAALAGPDGPASGE